MDKKYRRVRVASIVLFRTLARLHVTGLEHIPETGAFLLATNHISRLDTPLLGATCPRQVHALVAAKYQDYPFFRWFVNTVSGIWVRRTDFDREALLKAVQILRGGKVLGVAPEGTRSATADLQPGRPGAAFLAARVEVPIVPVGITGTQQMLPELRRLRRPELRVVYGAPFYLPKMGRLNSQELTEATDLIMRRIAALLPRSYQGVYGLPEPQTASR